jgi:hypothetical protein
MEVLHSIFIVMLSPLVQPLNFILPSFTHPDGEILYPVLSPVTQVSPRSICTITIIIPPLQHILTYLLTYSMEQIPSWEANRFAASQEIPRILWNPKVHYRIHKCPPHVSIQSIPPHTTSLRSALILSSHLRLCLPSLYSIQPFFKGKKFHNVLYRTCFFLKNKPSIQEQNEVKAVGEFYSLRRETKYYISLQESDIRKKFKFCSSSSYWHFMIPWVSDFDTWVVLAMTDVTQMEVLKMCTNCPKTS